MPLSKDDKQYLQEELERMKTYARRKFPNEFTEIQYEGRNAAFTPFQDKLYHNKDKRKRAVRPSTIPQNEG